MILKIAPPCVASKIPYFVPMMPLISNGRNHRFDNFRSCARSVRFLSPKVTLKKPHKNVYLNYRRLICGFRLCHSLKFPLVFIGFAVGFPVLFLCLFFNASWRIFSLFFYTISENVLPAKAGSIFSKDDFCQHRVQDGLSMLRMASKPQLWRVHFRPVLFKKQ